MTFVNPKTGETLEVPPPKYKIVAREFDDPADAIIYADEHDCVGLGQWKYKIIRSVDGTPIGKYHVFEIVPEGAA